MYWGGSEATPYRPPWRHLENLGDNQSHPFNLVYEMTIDLRCSQFSKMSTGAARAKIMLLLPGHSNIPCSYTTAASTFGRSSPHPRLGIVSAVRWRIAGERLRSPSQAQEELELSSPHGVTNYCIHEMWIDHNFGSISFFDLFWWDFACSISVSWQQISIQSGQRSGIGEIDNRDITTPPPLLGV